MTHKDQKFYEKYSWGSVSIKESKDIPTLKIRYLMDLLERRERKNVTLLEVGCGSGRILMSIRERDPHINLSGVDISKAQIDLAKKECAKARIDFSVAGGEKLPYPDNSFDYVVFTDVIEHVEDPDGMLREISRVLKPGGYLYGVSPAEGHGIYWLSKKVFGRHFKEETIGHIQQYTIANLLGRVKKQGLDVEYCKYSYHTLGSIMDYALFTMMLNKKVAKMFLEKNKYWRTKKTKQTVASRIMNFFLTLGNGIAYYESVLLQNVRFSATGVHIIAKKSAQKKRGAKKKKL